ncbi:MAG: class II fructose-bisphosphate aldolase [Erysipelotrichia bacterium]|nr:class II fructose-bisphosphate aldolase [Erysipelotrichia bacterium]
MKKNILLEYRQKGKAIGAFNVNTFDDMEAIVSGAAELNKPVILMASMSCCKFMGIDIFVKLCKLMEKKYGVQVISHLDHCTDIDLLYDCVNAGFDYVMYDGSSLSFEENVANTKKIVKYCHGKGVFVEGELGLISGNEENVKNDIEVLTNPEQMEKFINLTDVDSIAVSIGNKHGFYKGEPKLRFDLLKTLSDKSNIPLVLHGGTGIPLCDIKKAISMGISKINVGTDIRAAYLSTVSEYGKKWDGKLDIRHYITTLRSCIKNVAKSYMESY